MAFRNDVQGGEAPGIGGPGGGFGGMGGMGAALNPMGGGDPNAPPGQMPYGAGDAAGFEKTLKWQLLFFGGACASFGSGLFAVLALLLSFQWAPASFFSEFCLLIFGFLMLVLDLPIPLTHGHLIAVRDHCYKFMLFLTRFTGRGAWYLWLGTMVWVALWDVEENALSHFIAVICTCYLVILGVLAIVKGVTLSTKLHKVQNLILQSNRDASSFFARGQVKLTREQFKMVIEQASNNPAIFTDRDIDYVVGALKFYPHCEADGTIAVTIEEIEYWLRPGPMLLV